MHKITFLVLVAGLSATSRLLAQSTQVSFDSGNFTLYSDAAKTVPLSAGNPTTFGDGAMLQLGYYTQSTASNRFGGTFVSLAGAGSANVGLGTISIGDDPTKGAGTGDFALNLTFTSGSLTTGNNLPAAGQQLAVQFYNGSNLANSTAYNVATSVNWLWAAPANPTSTVAFNFNNANIQFLGGTSSAFYTSQPILAVPEPSPAFQAGIILFGFLALKVARRCRG